MSRFTRGCPRWCRAAAACALVLGSLVPGSLVLGCGAASSSMDRPGSSEWVRRRMELRAIDNLGCPAEQQTLTYLGHIRGTHWHRHEVSGCGESRRFWVACEREHCDYVVEALEERAALDFDCEPSAIEVEGLGRTMRATGCGVSGVYVVSGSEWIQNSERRARPE